MKIIKIGLKCSKCKGSGLPLIIMDSPSGKQPTNKFHHIGIVCDTNSICPVLYTYLYINNFDMLSLILE